MPSESEKDQRISDTHQRNENVLLRERKRHTACCVASARSAALSPDR